MPKWRTGMGFAAFLPPIFLLLLSHIHGQIWAQQTAEGEAERRAAAAGMEEDDLFILLDDISVYSCRGVRNEINLTEEDVQIVNERGNKVYYIKAPGNYSMHFKRINVVNPLAHLSGEIGVTLQVPIFEGPAGIRFDVPYTMIPETGLLNQQCDEHSGIVERDKRQYCRYCELCGLTDKIERGLSRGQHQFLPALAAGQEEAFSPKCGQIGAQTYEFKRTINLPGRRDLEQKVRQKISGVDAEIRKRLNKGRGRFQVFLNLISADQPPITMKAWFDGSEQCRCCGREREPECRSSSSVLSFLYCNAEDCKSAYSQQCLHNSARIVACYTVEFNYRMTTRREEVQQFLRENDYPDQDEGIGGPQSNGAASSAASDDQQSSQQQSAKPSNQPGLRVVGDEQRARQPKELSQRCVAQMATRLTHLRRYCTIFWNEKLCCSHCAGIC